MENYLLRIKNSKVRVQVSKFRLSNHKLMIETGRHRKLAKENRICPFCPCSVETEIHFLFHCPVYSQRREPLSEKLNDELLSDEQKLKLLLR